LDETPRYREGREVNASDSPSVLLSGSLGKLRPNSNEKLLRVKNQEDAGIDS